MTSFIRAIGKGFRLHNASELWDLGPGEVEITRRCGGNSVTEVKVRVFVLMCGCHVVDVKELGATCIACRQELEELQQAVLPEERLTLEQMNTVATPCHRHHHRCSFALCGVGGCERHLALGPDEIRWWCEPHFKEVTEQYELAEIQEKHGVFAARAVGFWRSLFFDK